jgi:hypothetical protein
MRDSYKCIVNEMEHKNNLHVEHFMSDRTVDHKIDKIWNAKPAPANSSGLFSLHRQHTI